MNEKLRAALALVATGAGLLQCCNQAVVVETAVGVAVEAAGVGPLEDDGEVEATQEEAVDMVADGAATAWNEAEEAGGDGMCTVKAMMTIVAAAVGRPLEDDTGCCTAK